MYGYGNGEWMRIRDTDGNFGKNNKNNVKIARTAMLAAIYAALTIFLAPISYGPIQLRMAEAMTVLPWFYPEATPGLFIGCIVANLAGGNGIWDVCFGSLATLTAAILSSRMKHIWLVPLPPVLVNALVVGAVLSRMFGLPFWLTAAEVGLGQIGACYLLGMPLLLFIQRREKQF